MPPFRYLGNILRLRDVRFGLGTGRGKAKITLAPTEAGLAYADGGLFCTPRL